MDLYDDFHHYTHPDEQRYAPSGSYNDLGQWLWL